MYSIHILHYGIRFAVGASSSVMVTKDGNSLFSKLDAQYIDVSLVSVSVE